jgi:hypothetical protein
MQRDPVLLDQDHHRCGGDRFGDRSEAKDRISGHWLPAESRRADDRLLNLLTTSYQRNHAWYGSVCHIPLEKVG